MVIFARSTALRSAVSHLRHISTGSTAAPVPSGLSLSSLSLRRAVFYVPCSDERKIAKSYTSAADCIMYDLEDGVSLNRKDQARSLVLQALSENPTNLLSNEGTGIHKKRTELGVRINSVGSGLEQRDLEVVLESPYLDTIMVPKVERPEDLRAIIAGIETALGLLNIREIAQASEHTDALLFAAEDYCADTGILRTPGRRELYYARSVVATTAHAFRLQAIDMVTMDFRSPQGAEMGFTGKQVIHPAQVDEVQRMFAPPAEAVRRAARIVEGYRVNYEAGRGAFDLDGKAIDMPVVKWAYRVLRQAELAGMTVE
ncbi:citrate lyase beta subunit [Kickxella alabastrina]|uniref:citrate lyase beta subunit n=1 Tax=Kickxella alabastrina TaxID=61397 RepID=UPI0022204094|nr:citrate lyase beta subunit [Kickxella alabastrina]KAI7828337.1 citrate lyase beta subunit [Kickxella alabastrina]